MQMRSGEANLDEAVAAASVNDTLYAYPMTADNGYFLYYDKNYLTEEDVRRWTGFWQQQALWARR